MFICLPAGIRRLLQNLVHSGCLTNNFRLSKIDACVSRGGNLEIFYYIHGPFKDIRELVKVNKFVSIVYKYICGVKCEWWNLLCNPRFLFIFTVQGPLARALVAIFYEFQISTKPNYDDGKKRPNNCLLFNPFCFSFHLLRIYILMNFFFGKWLKHLCFENRPNFYSVP